MPKVLLIGMGITAASALDSLVETCTVVGVVRAVRPADRDTDAVLARAARYGVPVFADTSIDVVRALVERLVPDCVVVSSYDRILPPDLVASRPFINVHYAPLPQFRGRATVNWAIITGQPFTAITIHALAEELDAGNVLLQRLVPIESRDTVGDLYEQLNRLQREHLGETVVRYLNGDRGHRQQSDAATYGCTRLPSDGEIDWSASTATVDALIRGLGAPYPGAFTYIDGRRLTIWRAEVVEHPPNFTGRIPGRVIQVSRDGGYADVLTGDGVLRLLDVELEAGHRVPAASVVRSVRATLGLRTADLLSRLEALERELAALRAQQLKTGEQHVHV